MNEACSEIFVEGFVRWLCTVVGKHILPNAKLHFSEKFIMGVFAVAI